MRHLHMKSLITSFIALIIFLLAFSGAPQAAISDDAYNIQRDKTWTITFNNTVDPLSANSNSIYIIDASGVKRNGQVKVSSNGKQVIVSPPVEGYSYSATYTLHITQQVRNMDGKSISKPIQKKFTIEAAPTFDVATIRVDGSTSVVRSFPSYELAAANLGAGQGILQAGAFVKMPAGLVATKPTASSSLTIIYADKLFKREETYVPADTELVYVNSTDAYVEVNVAGINRFIKHVNSDLIPKEAVRDRSYYYVVNSLLYHSIYSHKTSKFATYQVGPAPVFMRAGERYYSVDGKNFIDKNGAAIGVGNQYFQHLPIRSATQYTAEEIDAYIMTMLTKLEVDFPGNMTYQNASTRSKLVGIGTVLKKIEAEQHLNALHILALAQNESTYGLSARAQQYNNLFGLYVTDDNPAAKEFSSVEENIKELATAFLNKNYLSPGGYANGAVFGNKAVGMNVKYASDPYWGAKAAGHLYRIDKLMGGKEMANQHKLGVTNTSRLKARTGPGTNYPIAYEYVISGMPLIIVDDSLPESPWIKVKSESMKYDELYVHGSYVDKLIVVN